MRAVDLQWACIEIMSFFANFQLTVTLKTCNLAKLMVSVVVAQNYTKDFRRSMLGFYSSYVFYTCPNSHSGDGNKLRN